MIMFVHLQASEAQIMHDSWFDFALNKFHWHIFVSMLQEEFSGSQGLQRHSRWDLSLEKGYSSSRLVMLLQISRIRAWQIDGRQDPPRLGQGLNSLKIWGNWGTEN